MGFKVVQPTRCVTDVRGRDVRMLDPVLIHLLRPLTVKILNRPQAIPAEPLRVIAEELDRAWTRRGHLILLVYVVGLGLCYAGAFYYKTFLSAGRPWDIVGICFQLAQFLVMFSVFVITWKVAKRRRLPNMCGVMLKHLRCPHCGYDLRGLPIDSADGATVCPECGSSWMLADHCPTSDQPLKHSE